MNDHSPDRPTASLPFPSWEAIQATYHEAPAEPRSLVSHARIRRTTWMKLAGPLGWALVYVSFVRLSSLFTDQLDSSTLVVAFLSVFSWVLAVLFGYRLKSSRHRDWERDTVSFLHEEHDRILRERTLWRLASSTLGLLTIFHGLRVLLSFMPTQAISPSPISSASPLLPSALIGGGLCLLWVHSYRRSLRCKREEIHLSGLVSQLELPPREEALLVPQRRSRERLLRVSLALGLFATQLFLLNPSELPKRLFGRMDSPRNVLVISDAKQDYAGWLRALTLDAEQIDYKQARAQAIELSGTRPKPLEALIELADYEGRGFLLFDLRTLPFELRESEEIRFSRPRRQTDTFASINIGNLAPRGMTINFGRSEAWVDDPDFEERIELIRALFSHPVFEYIFAIVHSRRLGETLDKVQQIEDRLESHRMPEEWVRPRKAEAKEEEM